MGFIIRWCVAFVLLAATFNPTEWNYVHWATQNYSEQMPLAVLIGLLLMVGYIIYLRATLRSIGGFGMLLIAAIIGAVLWVLFDYGVLTLYSQDEMVWLGLATLATVLGIGLSWSHVRRRLSGQSDMDDVGD
ncbi:hypothetical protein G5B38_17875 [Pseudohalocynthiibacter aestuariivivens]|uniref:DUF6524 family protein n=1 Tax=Roseovarius pelagicus TaxID=2980108 RepID=A0ABY6DDH2_9RHOB|nr:MULTISPECIES: DUF6524 family protein [Rhodobacterales]QIE47244.1 hypothetical protein G5B38_17875 [Pseudohalocynthiibacter aestuariivivens]UXX84202.1 DUF6524 family protein [Roseovarius pelagicus]